jgi:manganese-dependent inorganic pyrophosphatase
MKKELIPIEQIYVTGHRNPDTDSVVSAMAYAALRNAVGDRQYVAARLGHLSDETKLILSRFGFEAPVYLKTMRTQVLDLDYDVPPILHEAVTVGRAWEAMEADQHVSAIPITDDEGRLKGLLTAGDITACDMRTITDSELREIPIFNILSVLEGQLLGETDELVNTITGEVVLALPQETGLPPFRKKDTILVCGNQPDMLRQAVEFGVNCVILCQAELPDDIRSLARETCIISTPYDGYQAVRRLFQAIPVSRLARRTELQVFHLEDFIDDVREVVLQSRYRSYPILDSQERVVGTLSRYHLIRPRRKQVVLVDHNEAAQSVPGLEQAEVLAIIDHHRLADIQTKNPIYFRNEPVGSTCTIVAGMYQERGLMPSGKLAGLLAAAIVSDTVMFKSPTATARDRKMAERMAHIAGISLEELGREIFSASTPEDKPVDQLLFGDFKEFHIAGHDLGVSQITCVDSDRQLKRKAEFLELMERTREEHGYSMVILMLTDVLIEGSKILCLGGEDIFQQAFNVELKDHEAFLPKVMSRKKQIIPMLSALWG